jgi:hypothetical protein
LSVRLSLTDVVFVPCYGSDSMIFWSGMQATPSGIPDLRLDCFLCSCSLAVTTCWMLTDEGELQGEEVAEARNRRPMVAAETRQAPSLSEPHGLFWAGRGRYSGNILISPDRLVSPHPSSRLSSEYCLPPTIHLTTWPISKSRPDCPAERWT